MRLSDRTGWLVAASLGVLGIAAAVAVGLGPFASRGAEHPVWSAVELHDTGGDGGAQPESSAAPSPRDAQSRAVAAVAPVRAAGSSAGVSAADPADDVTGTTTSTSRAAGTAPRAKPTSPVRETRLDADSRRAGVTKRSPWSTTRPWGVRHQLEERTRGAIDRSRGAWWRDSDGREVSHG